MNETTQKKWYREDKPIRQLVLWGWDEQQNPAFCILYGIQQTESRRDNAYVLKDRVEYKLAYIVKGKHGHFPSFPEVKPVLSYRGDLRLIPPAKKNIYYYASDKYCIQEGKSLEPKKILLSYFGEQSYASIVQEIKNQYGQIKDFRFADNPNDLLLFDQRYAEQFPVICQLFCSPNRYIRKKCLTELLDKGLGKSFYEQLLKIASTELSAGLFLELAKRKDDMLVSLAKQWKEIEPFAEKNYMDGVKRCADIYINSIDDKKKQEREQHIREHIWEMDLHFNGAEDNKESELLESEKYRRYAGSGKLLPYKYKSVLENRRWVYKQIPLEKHYRESIYCDGLILNILAVKNTVQEAEVYGLWDVIAKTAYYMDAPRLYYYFQANNGTNARRYFQRYLRRIMEHYAKTDSDTYIKIMKILLSSYQKGDYVSKFKGNFQSNYFISHFLYNRIIITPPNLSSYNNYWEYYKAEEEYIKSDQFLKQDGRFEAYPEIWNEHIRETAEIAIISEVEDIVKACYFILKENIEKLQSELREEQIVALSNSFYEPLMKLGQTLLVKLLKNIKDIKPEFLLALLKTANEELQQIAVSYLETHNIPLEVFVSMLFIQENMVWYPSWKKKIADLSEEEIVSFIKIIFEKKEMFKEWNLEEAADVLHTKLTQIKEYKTENKEKLFAFLYPLLWETEKLPKLLLSILEDGILSIDREELKKILKNYSLDKDERELLPENSRIIVVLAMIKENQLPSSYQISDLIEKGNSQIIHILLELLEENTAVLSERMELFLMFAESPILLLNEIAKKVFRQAEPEKKKEEIILLISSPKERAYQWGLSEIEKLYQDNIPKEVFLKLMEHSAKEVKSYIAEKSEHIIKELGNGNTELFLYYVKTLLYLPNKTAKSKQLIYEKLPVFIRQYPNETPKIEEILFDIGGSNCKKDSEQALVALARIRSEV